MAEQVMQRRTTRAFIAADPTDILLLRQALVKNERGGFSPTGEPTEIPARVHLSKSGPTGGEDRLTDSGREIFLKDLLVGLHDLDIETDDYFEAGGVTYQVGYVSPDRNYETRATLFLREGG
jgi:hypothetical protein